MAASCRPIRIDPLPNGGSTWSLRTGRAKTYPDPAGDVRMMIDGNVAFAQLWAVAPPPPGEERRRQARHHRRGESEPRPDAVTPAVADAKSLTLSLGGLVPCQAAPGFSTFAINLGTDVLELLFMAEEAVTITHVGLSVSAVAGTVPSFTVQLCNVTNGRAGATVHATGTFTPVAGVNWVGLGAGYAAARGQQLAVKVTSASATAANNATFNTRISNLAAESRWHVITVDAGGAAARRSACPSSRTIGVPLLRLPASRGRLRRLQHVDHGGRRRQPGRRAGCC